LSPDFPVSSNAFQRQYGGDTDAFVTILDTATSQLVYSTYFGGAGPDAAMDLKEDASGRLYVSGYTESGGLPTNSTSLQTAYDGYVDAFALKLNPAHAGTVGVDYFTYLGSDGIQVAYGVDYDSNGNLYAVGYSSSNILSRVGGPARNTITGNDAAFVIGFQAGEILPNTGASANPGHVRRYPWQVSPHR
jgi:hypothetical protein